VRTLNSIKDNLKNIPQADAWGQAGASPTSPAGMALANAATVVESRAAEATKGMFEQALAQGPAATRACWDSLSAAQRADLRDRFPQMIGSANGLPAVVRHDANLAVLASQRQALESKYRSVQNQIASIKPGEGMAAEKQRLETQAEEIQQALEGLNTLDAKVHQPDYFLLEVDSTASGGRGQAVIAHGNPDTAQKVMTTVPGTFSDMGDVMDYVAGSDDVMRRAQAMAPDQSFASITYAGYESPPTLVDAADGKFAENGSRGFSQFQEGLRVSHEPGRPPSSNTVIGHSYGTTEIGYAARDHGIHADKVVFMGSPGVGVDHASELGVPPENVWSGTANLDAIDYATPSANPLDWGDHYDDKQWFGRNPSDPNFGARELPVHTWSGHSDYCKYDESLDGMARVVADQTGDR
jgi:hypothetical protein